jgi:hypothetical protein
MKKKALLRTVISEMLPPIVTVLFIRSVIVTVRLIVKE